MSKMSNEPKEETPQLKHQTYMQKLQRNYNVIELVYKIQVQH
jgi:hypothetical protein